MTKTAIILGATGLTGNILLHKLIKDERYDTIKLFSRSKIDGLPSKVVQHIGNLLEFDQFKPDFNANDVFCCIGTTTKKTPDKSLYRQIDYGIPVATAKLSKENNIKTFLVISAMGADADSSVFYNKTKGEMERDILLQKIDNTFILRPGLIGGDRNEKRLLEKIGLAIFKCIEPLLRGKLKHYKIIEPDDIAQCMINLANSTNQKQVIIKSNNIKELSNKN